MHSAGRRITVGLLGGSFNPAHEGHRYISLEAIKRLGLDEVWWLVSPQNPLKPTRGMLPFEERVTLAKKNANHPKIFVSTIEQYFQTRYTYDTLLKIKEKYPKIRFIWLMGEDNLVQFPKWQRWRDIVENIPIVVFCRGNNTYKALHSIMAYRYAKYRCTGLTIRNIRLKKPPSWVFLPIRKHPASATALRKD